MRVVVGFALLGLLLSGCATMGATGGNPPVLRKIVLREAVGRYDYFYPTLYFQADGGDVVAVRRRILSTTSPRMRFNPVSHIRIAPDQQKAGAVWVGGWGCGPNASTTTVRAYLVDRRGRQSNSLDYTVVCRSASELFGGRGP